MQIHRAQENHNKMSRADMCETTDNEEDKPIYGDLNEEKTEGETATEMSCEDKRECGEIKENDPETLETVESTDDSSTATEEVEYRMDKPSAGVDWFWDGHVFMTFAHQFEENGNKTWLLLASQPGT